MSRGDWERVKRVATEALARPAADRARFAASACGGDEALCREVLSLLESMEQVGERFETPALAMPAGRRAAAEAIGPPRAMLEGGRIGAWRILRQLGHGGMGTVYLAERVSAEFHQRAAIKIVRGGSTDEILLRRFQEERRILAALDHPHIAHLIDGGATELGLPYVVMEYVEGRPIDRFCDELALDVRQRLEVFRLVCLAVHYAHQRLVVHRDLKASNILVTAEGVPKLLDFGIAKILEADRPAAQTHTLMRVLTPESASPEQLRGDPITTATDIYALGVLLYRLLTGRSPYRLSTSSETELIRAVCEQAPAPPSVSAREAVSGTVPRAIDRDLDRIVLMALRKEPARRYSTAEQLADDLRRYLEGRPVVAGPDSATYRARKFVGRNRVAVGAAAGFVAALAGGVVATTWQARVARQERNRAQHEFNAVRSLASSVLGELHDSVAALPGSLAARELLVRRATEYLDALAADAGHDASLRRELALGYLRLAEVQGAQGMPNIGDRQAARRSYEKVEALFRSLDADSLDVPAAVAMIRTDTELANSDADPQARAAHRDRAHSLVERFLRAAPSDRRVLRAAVTAWFAEASDREGAKDYAGALESFLKVAPVAETRLAMVPNDLYANRDLSLTYKKIGTQLEMLHRVDEAMASYEKALALDRARVDADPGTRLWRLDLSFAYGAIGAALTMKEEYARALEHYRRAVELRRSVVDADPNDDFAQMALARGHQRVAGLLAQLGNVDGAIQADFDRLAVLDRRRAAHPERDNVWLEQTTAMMDAAQLCLDMLENNRGPAVASQARRVRGMLDRVSALQAQWVRDKRSGVLPPQKADLNRAIERCERLIRS